MCLSHLFPVGTLTIYFHLTLREENIEDRGDSGHTHEYRCIHNKPESQYIKAGEQKPGQGDQPTTTVLLTSRKELLIV